MSAPLTHGVHHVGLAVSNLEGSADFFTRVLGWQEVKRREDYPAIFVSDGCIMVTLWATEEGASPFDRRKNVGLHHLALHVQRRAELTVIHQRLVDNGIRIEFTPTELNGGPAMHMMCYDPSGIRIEFYWTGIES